MDSDTPDVTQSAPSPDAPTDRPIQNVVGEFNRKFSRVEQQLQSVTEALGALMAEKAAPAPAKPATKGDPVDEELWDRATKGDRDAFNEHQRRLAARTYAEIRQVEDDRTLTESQIRALYAKYPVLANGAHPLAQTAAVAHQLLVKRGRPNDQTTYLDALKTAIADRPDLVSEMHAQGPRAKEAARRDAANRAGTGATYRNEGSGEERVRFSSPSAEEQRLAQRMGVKDINASKERFLKRHEEGRSSLGLVANSVDLEKF